MAATQPRSQVIARSSDGRVIRKTKIHHPGGAVRQAWKQTGTAMRNAMNKSGSSTS